MDAATASRRLPPVVQDRATARSPSGRESSASDCGSAQACRSARSSAAYRTRGLSVLSFPMVPQSGDGERLPVLQVDIDRLLVPSVLVVGQFDLASIEWSPPFFKPFWRMPILPFVITFTLYAIPPFSFVLL